MGSLLAGLLVTATFACSGTSTPSVITVTNAQAMPSPGDETMAIVTLTVQSSQEDRLTSVAVPESVAQRAQYVPGPDLGGVGGHLGHLDGKTPTAPERTVLRLKRNTPMELVADGPRIELVGLTHPPTTGTRFTLTLRFASGAEITTNVVSR